MKTFRISDIEFEATELMETLSVHDQTYVAIGYNEKGHKYIGTAHVSCGEIVDVIDIETSNEKNCNYCKGSRYNSYGYNDGILETCPECKN